MTELPADALYDGLTRVLLSEHEIRARVAVLGREISQHYGERHPVLVGVLTGAYAFMADLSRALPIPLDIEFMAVSSYGLQTETSGVVRIVKDLDGAIDGREILIVEDIVDSGLTLAYLLDVLRRRDPLDIKVVTLLLKDKPKLVEAPIDWVGFAIPDEFVVGYGLDAGKRFRNLPFIAVCDGG
ncbi:MAG TPA: hypoxanthine phosphoribosyltransferase [Thermomicrobiales bacterium]|nr:hypoxanthine phosphoribosyltransferase [Thermomicrobiales bacterium]